MLRLEKLQNLQLKLIHKLRKPRWRWDLLDMPLISSILIQLSKVLRCIQKEQHYHKKAGLEAGNGPAGYGPIRHVNQTSSKWNKLSMGGLSFREAGCGPSVMAMLLDKLDIKYDMAELVRKAIAMKQGAMSGTPMSYFKSILAEHRIQSSIVTSNVVKLFLAELKAGRSPILLTVSSTGAPHFIIGKELRNNKIYINDPEKTNSEAITLNDKRLRMAKAILIYKTKSAVAHKLRTAIDVVKGGYGAVKILYST